MVNTYIDAEWYLNQRIFLIGYGYENTITGKISTHQLYKENINKADILKILKPTTGKIYIYGPDIGMLEKVFQLDIRQQYNCINLIKIIKDCYPNLNSYKLAEMEKHFGFKRKAAKYKSDIFSIYKDWQNKKLKQLVLQYNNEDVYYLIKVKQKVFQKFFFPRQYLNDIRLK